MRAAVLRIALIVAVLVAPTLAQDPCAGQRARALVLGGGGSKGAFEVGAAYHLIVHRECDFAEFSGTSVGALNGAVLAQAALSTDAEASLVNAKTQAEALVSMWQTIESSKDVIRGRPLASARVGLFGMEAMKNFAPLRKLIAKNVELKRLDTGRELRVGTVSLHDGRYHEFVLNANGQTHRKTLDFLLASAAIPMIAALPRIAHQEGAEPVQFGDGGLRHNTPVRSYFVQCSTVASPSRCRSIGNHGIPPHPRTEQLFVITTKPYEAELEATPVWDTSVFKAGTYQITDGRKVMARAVSVVMDAVYHQDLDSTLLANDLLEWRDLAYIASPDDPLLDSFPLESYNFDPQRPEAGSRAYTVGIVSPLVGDTGMDDVLSFSRERIAKQMYCGCMAADEMMQKQFGLQSMSHQCRERFHPLGDTVVLPDCRSRMIEPVWSAAVGAQPRQAGAK